MIRFPARIEKNAIPSSLIQQILNWSKENHRNLISKSFSGEYCKNDDSEGHGPGDKELAITKLNDPDFMNSHVYELKSLIMSKLRDIIKEFAFSGEIKATLKAYDRLLLQKKIPLYIAHNWYKKGSGAAYAIHRDSFAVFATAVVPIQESGDSLQFPSQDNKKGPTVGDIGWVNPDDSHEVKTVGEEEDRISIVITI